MKLRTRRIIMYCFILAFFIIGPILIFYASGYRFDFKREKIIKTGTLYLEAKDVSKISLYINNELYETPFNSKLYVYNLLPGDYDVRLEKNGYYPWEKKLSVYSNITTFAQNIVLFQKEAPMQIVNGKIIDFSLSPDYQNIVYLVDTNSYLELYQYNVGTRESNLLDRLAEDDSASINFAASSKKVLLKLKNRYSVYDIENLKIGPDLKTIINFIPQNLKWDLQSDTLLYAEYKNSIYQLDIFGKKNQKIYESKSKINPEFYVEGNDIFFIQQNKNGNILYKYNLNFKTTKKVLDLAPSSNYQFSQSNNDYIGLTDLDQQKFYLIKKTNSDDEINISEEPIKQFDAKAVVWDKNGKQLLLYNDFEIYTYNPDTGEENMINRYGQVIQKAMWYPNLFYLAVQFNDSLQMIDLTLTNGTRAVTEVAKPDQISDFFLNEDGNALFFDGRIGQQEGLYKLKLK